MKIDGRAILITGGASGIGLAYVKHLRELGARIWVIDRDEPTLDGMRCPERVEWHRCDVGAESEVIATVEEVDRVANGIDILINNAAILRDQTLVSKLGGKIRKHAMNDWTDTLRCNVTGTFLMAREVAARMIARARGGLIVNTSSVSRRGNPGQSAYSASKAAIDALTRTWARELAVHRIRVVGIAPGFVETGMTHRIPPMFLERIRTRTPLQRFGRLEEFAATIQFVIENDYLNGTILEVDGGLVL